MTQNATEDHDELVPDDVIPHRHLPPLRYRDLPAPISWRKMLGPSIILAGLSLGSGEFIIWPHIVSQSGFVFFWACMLGVITQFFLNMEIERWTLATGESAITGFCRISRHWAWAMLLLTIIPFAWPGWATGAGSIVSWVIYGPQEVAGGESVTYTARYGAWFGIAGLVLVGVLLTAGPVVYNTVEKVQFLLVGGVLVLVAVISILVIRPDAVAAMLQGIVNLGGLPELKPDPAPDDLTYYGLLGALAFAGAGGAMNLGQSNFIKDKGYGMGQYIGRITSPITGQEEPIADVGFHFPHSEENLARWRQWWRAANVEHFWSFLVTCVFCLCLLALIAYSLVYRPDGTRTAVLEQFGSGMNFVWGQATALGRREAFGGLLRIAFLIMGVAILLTTELGILDAVARIAADVVKVNYLRGHERWTQSRLYYCFLWGEIAIGTAILLSGLKEPLLLLRISAALNGGVMFLYSMVLLYMNNRMLRGPLGMSWLRRIAIAWSCLFFGFFTVQALRMEVLPALFGG